MAEAKLRDFVPNLDKSRLLGGVSSADLWQEACAESPDAVTAEGFAAWLVQKGKLTRHQADKLLRGHTRFFLDDYKITDLIGAGRMAGVYRALHKLGMPVAVKILPPKSVKQPELLARFEREAQLALQLDHPHVVKTYHAGVSDGLHYIAMEYLEGETLEDRIKERGKLPPDEVVRIARQALEALQHLNDKGMVHRDVKPGNLMLATVPGGASDAFTVKLLDVGLGRALFSEDDEEANEDLTAAGAKIGTPDYTAPEQTRDSHAADIRSDLYSLGCTLYHCLAGRVPFGGKSAFDKLVQHAKEMPPALDLQGYPRATQLHAWLWKLLAKDPAERFQTPADAGRALQAIAEARAPERASPAAPGRRDATPIAPSPPRARGGPIGKILAGVAAVLVVVGGVVFFLNRDAERDGGPPPDTSADKRVASVDLKDVGKRTPTPSGTEKVVPPAKKESQGKSNVPAKEPSKKEEPKKDPPKVVEPEPKKPEPEPKVVAKKVDPEPEVPPAKKEEMKEPEPPPMPADDRLPLPAAAEVTRAEAAVKGALGAEYAKTKAADRVALATKLLAKAGGADNPAVRFVMLRDARNIAAAAGNAQIAMDAAQEIAGAYQTTLGRARTAVLDSLVSAPTTPAAAAESTEALLVASDAARESDDWATAVAVARAAESVARKSQSAVLVSMAQSRAREAEAMKAEFDRAKGHRAALEKNPGDAAANFGVGRYLIVVKQQWEAGDEMLAKGPPGKWREAAEADLRAASGATQDLLAAADAWYDLSKTTDFGRATLQTRAHTLYSGTLNNIGGLEKIRVEKRFAELQAAIEGRVGPMKVWMANRQAVLNNQVRKDDLVGGNPAMREFEEVAKDGAFLVGFSYHAPKNGLQPPIALQPIYRSPRGEVRGAVYGSSPFADLPQATRAKPGYAVGAIVVRATGAKLQSIKPIYMKIVDSGLDPNNRYVGEHIGDDLGNEKTVGGDGNFIVGVHGKTTLDNLPGTLSVISVSKAASNPGSKD